MPDNYIPNSNLRHQTRLACGLIPLFNRLQELNIDINLILEASHIRKVEFLDPAFTITLEQELNIVEASLKYLDKPDDSIKLAKHVHLHNFSVLGLTIRSCANLAEIFEVIVSYPRLQWSICETTGERVGDQLCFSLYTGNSRVERFLLERDMACVKTLFSEALARELQLDFVHFSHQANGSISTYEDFFNCPVLFNQKSSCFAFNVRELDKPVPTADPLSKAFYEAQCARLSAEIDEPFLYSTLIRDHLSKLTPIPSLNELSQKLNIETRTIQRLLKKEGDSFSKILLEVRLKRAKDRLLFSNLTIEQISTELGFNDAVAFSHAFKQWTEQSPKQWLKQQ